jgi:hypothetical protein
MTDWLLHALIGIRDALAERLMLHVCSADGWSMTLLLFVLGASALFLVGRIIRIWQGSTGLLGKWR